MGRALRSVACVLFVLSFCVLTVRAQVVYGPAAINHSAVTEVASQDPPFRIEKGTNEFSIWGGGAFRATTFFGGITEEEARGRKFAIVGLRYGRVFAASERVSYEYTLDVIPVAVAFQNIVSRSVMPTIGGTAVTTNVRENVYGAGLAPLGLQVNFGQQQRVKPFVGVTGGFLIFREPVPLPDSGKFAFTADASGGVRILARERRAIDLGIKFHHISNGDRRGSNRGLNSFVFYAGFSIFR